MNINPTYRRLVVSFAILLTSLAAPAQQEQYQSPITTVRSQDEAALVGRWEGRDSKGILGWFEFSQNGDADFSIDGKSFKKSVVGNNGTLSFKVDAGAIPWSLDLIATRNDGKVLTMPCIMDFVGTDGLIVRCSYSGTRPTSFEGANENEFIRLSKQK